MHAIYNVGNFDIFLIRVDKSGCEIVGTIVRYC